MVAYNFQRQFVEPIKTGRKKHTIRKNGKRDHAKPGDRLQLYTGMRTKSCNKIVADDPECVLSVSIQIEVGFDRIHSIYIGGDEVDDLDYFAKSDGFESINAMHKFWVDFNGVGCFHGTMIGWE